ncbi:MAG: M23 family metallopeptidase [Bacilli bacterium]|nr:M23 family metallopeptidase [Bacilli bacterium]
MNKKQKGITLLITILSLMIMLLIGFGNRLKDSSKTVFQVYLNGQKLGLINNQEELLNKINEEQTDIKTTYGVDKVYPPNNFEIIRYKTYEEEITPVEEIYNKVKDKGDFTIKGYTISITKKKTEESDEKKLYIYVLDTEVFKKALEMLITAFVDKEDYQNYINNTQEEITNVGQIIEHMYFEESITIKESNISIKDKIYTDATELGQFLLFGKEETSKKYTVQKGDTIAGVAEANQLNTEEFLIANPRFKSKDSLLAIGEEVSVDLISPVLTLVEELHVVEDTEQVYESEEVRDNSKPYDYREITQAGITGIVRTTQEVKMTNGERSQGTVLISSVTIREAVNEIATIGKARPTVSGRPPLNTGNWGWPTNRPYIITSNYEWRWGSFHNAIDISGTGFGSPIYAAKDGTVVQTNNNCANIGYYGSWCGMSYGNYIVIQHSNNYYTMYAHLTQDLKVNVGDRVGRGQVIGLMGSSGSSTGTHLHYGVSIGLPHSPGSRWLSPWSLY